MCCRLSRLRVARRFAHQEDGAATIEAVLWLPFFLMLFGLLADVSMIFYNQSRLLRIVQDANRNFSVERLANETETAAFVESQALSVSANVVATTTKTAGLITTSATVPIEDLDLFGVAGVFGGVNMTIRAQHLSES